MDRKALQTHSIGALEHIRPHEKHLTWNGPPTPRNGPPSLNNKKIGIKLKTKMVRMAQMRATDVDGGKQLDSIDKEEEDDSNINSYPLPTAPSGCRLSQALSYYEYTCDTGGWSQMDIEQFAQKRIDQIKSSR